jgi:predicted O-linked N-acetylglucosamine transferase (SPINDLY family)
MTSGSGGDAITLDQAAHVGFQHQQAGRLREAEQIYRQILARDPRHFDALQLLGLIAHGTGHHADAVELMSRAVQINGAVAGVRVNLASALRACGRREAALAEAQMALRLDPHMAGAALLCALILSDLGRLNEAEGAWRRLIELQPRNAEAHGNLAATLEMLGRIDQAAAAARRAVEIDPNYALGFMNLGAALGKLGRLEDALASHRRAAQLRPNLAMAHVNIAFIAQQIGLLEEAETASRRAIEIDPNEVGGHQNLAAALQDQGRLDEAGAAFGDAVRLLEARAAATAPTNPARAAADRHLAAVLGAVAVTLLPPIYDSNEQIDRWRQRLIDGIAQLRAAGTKLQIPVEPAPTLFTLAYQGRDDLAINRDFAALIAPPPDPPPTRPRGEAGKIRVGFISRFFRSHTIGRLNMGLVDQLDRSAFEVTVISVGDPQDDVGQFFRRRADRFVTLPPRLDVSRQLVADAKLDVLFYADIGMDPLTYSLAHSRLAPVQCVTWGHPVTSGIPAIDYFISSESLESPGSEAQYTEKLVKLPSLAVYYFRPKLTSTKTRADFRLRDDATLYGCLQMLWKFHPDFDAILGDLLRRDRTGEVLIVKGLTPLWDERLMARFRRTIGDVADRIRFVDRQPYEDFLALTAACDVMLDPVHFGGGNTTYEALAFGVPVVTLPSNFLRGRITKALYDQMGMTDCVADSTERYIEIAATLGTDRAAREAMRQTILPKVGVLYENPAAVRQLEDFFRTVAR